MNQKLAKSVDRIEGLGEALKVERSELPWYVDASRIYNANKKLIATNASDLECIVKCVNSHADLVAALEFYADPKRYEGPNQKAEAGDEHTPSENVYRQDVIRDQGDIARAALAKANQS